MKKLCNPIETYGYEYWIKKTKDVESQDEKKMRTSLTEEPDISGDILCDTVYVPFCNVSRCAV